MTGSKIFVPLPIDQVGLRTACCSIKWVPTTKWVWTPQLVVSTKWLHAPSDVLMLNVLLEWVATHFVENGSIVMHVARDGLYKIGAGNFHNQLIPNQPQKKCSIKWHPVWRGKSIYKMGWPTPPTLKTRWININLILQKDPTHFVEETGGGTNMCII